MIRVYSRSKIPKSVAWYLTTDIATIEQQSKDYAEMLLKSFHSIIHYQTFSKSITSYRSLNNHK